MSTVADVVWVLLLVMCISGIWGFAWWNAVQEREFKRRSRHVTEALERLLDGDSLEPLIHFFTPLGIVQDSGTTLSVNLERLLESRDSQKLVDDHTLAKLVGTLVNYDPGLADSLVEQLWTERLEDYGKRRMFLTWTNGRHYKVKQELEKAIARFEEKKWPTNECQPDHPISRGLQALLAQRKEADQGDAE
jgi:hypothetical protein